MKSSGQENAVTNSRHGQESDTANSSTESPAPTAEATRLKIVSGDAAEKTAVTAGEIIPVRSSPLSEEYKIGEYKGVEFYNPPISPEEAKHAQQLKAKQLSADEAQRLARIARDRANRFMVAAPDVDFLLDVITRFQ